jgi:hypothetical protein
MAPIESYFAKPRTALAREAAMCLFFRLTRLSDSGAGASGIVIERRTFIPLSTGVHTLYGLLSLGVSYVSQLTTGASCEKGRSGEGGIHTHGCDGGGLIA